MQDEPTQRLPDWYESALAAGRAVASRRVFFVAGCQKSGTTWVGALLDSHPQVCCGGEGHISDIAGPLIEQAISVHNAQKRATRDFDRQETFALVRLAADVILARYLESRPSPGDVRFLGDRTPEAACGILPLATLYPDAKFIHVIRDGRDGAVSGWAHLGRGGGRGRFPRFADYAEYFARGHWVPYIRRARAAGRRLPGRYVEVRYEDLSRDASGQARRLLSFLGADDGPEMVRRCTERSAFQALSGGRRPGEEDPSSHLRKGVVGDWMSRFDDEALERFEAQGGELLRELGYAGREVAPGR